MSIAGIGTDIVSVLRIRQVHERHPQRFAEKILSGDEWESFSRHPDPPIFLAKRFAVKEAAAKALGTGMQNGVWFSHFSVDHTAVGQPQLVCTGGARTLMKNRGIRAAYLSLSDETEYVVAFVVFEF